MRTHITSHARTRPYTPLRGPGPHPLVLPRFTSSKDAESRGKGRRWRERKDILFFPGPPVWRRQQVKRMEVLEVRVPTGSRVALEFKTQQGSSPPYRLWRKFAFAGTEQMGETAGLVLEPAWFDLLNVSPNSELKSVFLLNLVPNQGQRGPYGGHTLIQEQFSIVGATLIHLGIRLLAVDTPRQQTQERLSSLKAPSVP